MNSKDYIYKLIEEGEHQQQDFKFEISDARKIAKSLSAFSNTDGGRLLIGVKDNGKIAGVRSEEEIYMIEAAAKLYCQPQVNCQMQIHDIDGHTVLEVIVPPGTTKPYYAKDQTNKCWAYIRKSLATRRDPKRFLSSLYRARTITIGLSHDPSGYNP